MADSNPALGQARSTNIALVDVRTGPEAWPHTREFHGAEHDEGKVGSAQDGRRDAGHPAGAGHVARLEVLAQLRGRTADAAPCAIVPAFEPRCQQLEHPYKEHESC